MTASQCKLVYIQKLYWQYIAALAIWPVCTYHLEYVHYSIQLKQYFKRKKQGVYGN